MYKYKDLSREEVFEISKAHFIERLKERYDIDITGDEYKEMLKLTYNGIIHKNYVSSVGHINWRGTKIWVGYNSNYKVFSTALPPIIEFDIHEAIRTTFGFGHMAFPLYLYSIIEKELLEFPTEFASLKEAAIYYQKHSKFPNLLIERFKYGTIPVFKICHVLKNLISGNHHSIKIDVVRRDKV